MNGYDWTSRFGRFNRVNVSKYPLTRRLGGPHSHWMDMIESHAPAVLTAWMNLSIHWLEGLVDATTCWEGFWENKYCFSVGRIRNRSRPAGSLVSETKQWKWSVLSVIRSRYFSKTLHQRYRINQSARYNRISWRKFREFRVSKNVAKFTAKFRKLSFRSQCHDTKYNYLYGGD